MRGSIQYAAAPVGDQYQTASWVDPDIRFFSGPALDFDPLIIKIPPIMDVFKNLVKAHPLYNPLNPQISFSLPGFFIHATLVHVLVTYGTGENPYKSIGNHTLTSLLQRVLQTKKEPDVELAIAPIGVDVLYALMDAARDVETLCAAVASREEELEKNKGWTPLANGKRIAGIQLSHEPGYDNPIPFFHDDQFPGCTRIQFPGEADLAITFEGSPPEARAQNGDAIVFRGARRHSRAWVSETDPQACRPRKNLDRTLAMATMFTP